MGQEWGRKISNIILGKPAFTCRIPTSVETDLNGGVHFRVRGGISDVSDGRRRSKNPDKEVPRVNAYQKLRERNRRTRKRMGKRVGREGLWRGMF